MWNLPEITVILGPLTAATDTCLRSSSDSPERTLRTSLAAAGLISLWLVIHQPTADTASEPPLLEQNLANRSWQLATRTQQWIMYYLQYRFSN